MKKLFILLLASVLLYQCSPEKFQSVDPETPTDYHRVIQDYATEHGIEIPISKYQVDSLMKLTGEGDTCYKAYTLIQHILPNWNKQIPDVIPAWSNYFQDANSCTLARFTAVVYTRAEDSTMVYMGSQAMNDVSSIQWFMYDSLVYSGIQLYFTTYNYLNPFCPDSYQPPCNGAHEVTMRMVYKGHLYERTGNSFALVNDAPVPVCDPLPVPSLWSTPSNPLFFGPYEFYIGPGLDGDLNGDMKVNMADLLIFLANVC